MAQGILGFSPEEDISTETIQAAYRELAKLLHPDLQGGSHEAMAMLNEARDAALAWDIRALDVSFDALPNEGDVNPWD